MIAPHRPIDFYFDFSSPYSYIASEWIEALAARHGRTVNWKAILLGATFQAAELKSPVSYPLKREYSLLDFERSARFAGVPLKIPENFPIPTQNAARVFWWQLERGGNAAASHWARHCLRAFFARGVDLERERGAEGAVRRVRPRSGRGRGGLERARMEGAAEGRERRGDCARRVRRAVLHYRRRAVLGQRPAPQIERWLDKGPF